VLWDNYPCNDDAPTMHLGPLVGRDSDLPSAVDGYMTNPMRRQNRLGRLPLATAADYARDPGTYDPAASMRSAIRRVASPGEERAILTELVALYAGSIARGENQYFNPVRAAMIQASDKGRAAWIRDLEALVGRFQATFGERYPAELDTLRSDLSYATGAG
jgi:hyaluronoglucosaminidase